MCISIEVITLITACILSSVALYSAYLQYKFHKTTLRPFIYVDSLTLEIKKNEKGETIYYNIGYHIKNVGSLPAKKIQYNSSLESELKTGKKIDFKSKESYSSLFPNQEITAFRYNVAASQLKASKYFHIYNVYFDVSNRLFHTSYVFVIGFVKEQGKIQTFHVRSELE